MGVQLDVDRYPCGGGAKRFSADQSSMMEILAVPLWSLLCCCYMFQLALKFIILPEYL